MRSLREPRPAALSVAVLAACAGAAWLLTAIGAGGRVHGAGRAASAAGGAVRIVRNSRELQAELRRHAGHGRIVVSASAYLHFEEPELGAFWAAQDAFPVRAGDLAPALEAAVDVRNHLWVALRAGIAREIIHVVPPAVLREKQGAAAQDPTDVVSRDGGAITLHWWGSRRTIRDTFPAPDEPVILEVDASYFELADPEGLARELRASGLAADLVALGLAEDNPAVSARGRAGLARFAALIGAEASGAR